MQVASTGGQYKQPLMHLSITYRLLSSARSLNGCSAARSLTLTCSGPAVPCWRPPPISRASLCELPHSPSSSSVKAAAVQTGLLCYFFDSRTPGGGTGQCCNSVPDSCWPVSCTAALAPCSCKRWRHGSDGQQMFKDCH